jgi:hypothetical protein
VRLSLTKGLIIPALVEARSVGYVDFREDAASIRKLLDRASTVCLNAHGNRQG